jgi:hypothetical protein
MYTRLFVIGVSVVIAASGQGLQRRASLSGGSSPDRGKCTVEVVVDGAAEVEIRGDGGTLRNLAGGMPQWRRFECTSPMPGNPQNFRFTGVDGRGSQELVRGPQNGSGAVVRIQDAQGGSEGYTFDLTWGGGDRMGGRPGEQGGGRMGEQRGADGRDRREGERFTTAQAVRVCQDTVRQQAMERFHSGNVAFRTTALDDNPGRQDWVTGLLDIRRGYDRDENYRFSCAVNFETGEVRSAQIEPVERDHNREMPGEGNRVAVDSCRRSVEQNIQQKGYQHVDFLTINIDDQPGRNDWVVGTARADVRYRSDSFTFSCSVDLRDGDVRTVDVRRR